MEEILKYIIENTINKRIPDEVGIKLISDIKKTEAKSSKNKKIAIIGVAAKYPYAENIEEYWDLINGKQDCMSEFPENRECDISDYVGNQAFQKAGYLKDIDMFDNNFFKITPKEADIMDPNQRLFLQNAYEAIEDAGYGGKRLMGSATGVFVGYSNSLRDNYCNYIKNTDESNNPIVIQANLESIIPSRLSYYLDLKGPSVLIDTACSSSLAAIDSAVKSLNKRECDYAIASGMKINFYLLQDGLKLGIESPRMETSAFDDRADGTSLGEGIGTVVLKRYEAAVKDNDHIYAVIIGNSINQDGYGAGITVPNVDSQISSFISAWEEASISPETIGYIETHGTGTKIGDPMEAEAITKAFKRYTDKKQICAIGSVKANLGHLFEGAGMASFIKAILCLNKKMLPSNIHFKIPSSKIDWMDSAVYFSDQGTYWTQKVSLDGIKIPRRCGVSAFGLSGTNCHILLEEHKQPNSINSVDSPRIFALSSQSQHGLHKIAEKFYTRICNGNITDFDAMCHVLYTGRGHYNHRLSFVFNSKQELLDKLNVFLSTDLIDAEIVYREIVFSKQSRRDGHKVSLTPEDLEKNNEKAELIIEKLGEENLEELCILYAEGAEIKWSKISKCNKKISLPVYEYEHIRHWLTCTENNKVIPAKTRRKGFISNSKEMNSGEYLFECNLSAESDFVLSNHVILGKPTLPGTVYLEIACEIAEFYFGKEPIEMHNFRFMMPIVLAANATIKLQITASRKTEQVELFFYSGLNTEHAAVTMQKAGDVTVTNTEIRQLIEQADEIKKIDQNQLTKGFIDFGERWINYRTLYRIGDAGLAEIKLPENLADEAGDFILHPSMTDMGVNALSLTLGKPYLPLFYKHIKVYKRLDSLVYSYIRPLDSNVGNDAIKKYNISFLNKNGECLAEFNGYAVKKVDDAERFGKSVAISEIKWIEKDIYSKEQLDDLIIFAKKCPWVQEFTNYLSDRRIRYMLLDEYENAVIEKFKNILYINSDVADVESVGRKVKRVIGSPLNLVKLLSGFTVPVNLTILTQYAYRILSEKQKHEPEAAMISGMCKTLSAENRHIKTKHIDTDGSMSFERLLSELSEIKQSDTLAYRNGIRYVPQVNTVSDSSDMEYQPLKQNGVYVITGGRGGIGLKTAEMFARHEKVNLVLVNRKGFPEKDVWADISNMPDRTDEIETIRTVQKIEESGSSVAFYQADVSDESQVKTLIEKVREEIGEINGIVHGAGAAGGGLIKNSTWEQIEKVLAPKVYGTEFLLKYADTEALDFVLLFSSIASLAGVPGQISYTMANNYLDAIVDPANKKIMTVNWPAWNDVGMAVNHNNINETYIMSINSDEGMFALWDILCKKIRHSVVGNWKLDDLKNGTFMELGSSFQRKIDNTNGNSELDSVLQPVETYGRQENDYNEDERKIAAILGNVLGLSRINIYDNFNDIGGNSIFAVKMLELLNKEYNNCFDVTDMFSYSSVYHLADHVRGLKKIEEPVEEYIDDKLDEMLELLSNGEMEIDDIDKFMKDGVNI